jgi:anti-sigma B factor antagonist
MSTEKAQPGARFEIHVAHQAGAAVVRLCGPATMEYSDAIRERLLAVASEEQPVVVLDLSELTFVNSIGLGAFVTAHVRCRNRGGALKLAAPRENVRSMLELTKLTRLFEVCDSVEAAIGGGARGAGGSS